MKKQQVNIEPKSCVEFLSNCGKNFEHEDELIAFELGSSDRRIRTSSFGRLYEKYYEIAFQYLELKFPNISATGRDIIVNKTFRRIFKNATKRLVRTKNGSLSSFVILICEWEARKIYRTEVRRRNLTNQNINEFWCIQQENKQLSQSSAISEQDVEELLVVLRQALEPGQYPNSSIVLEAMSTIFIRTGGLQIVGCDRNPSVSAIENYLESEGIHLSEKVIKASINVIRAVAKRVLVENGWEIESTVPRQMR